MWNVDLTLHVDAFHLVSSGAVTVRNVDGDLLAIETFIVPADSVMPAAAGALAYEADQILRYLGVQLPLPLD